ncbi:MAG: HK97 family phage prohead protease [Bacteroidota bacterium]|nr:HK97 family phage prohead protease [Bacteroidota bacterium]
MDSDTFRFNLDADIEKSTKGGESLRIIRGYASNDSEDRQGETLLQKGLDISNFVNYGFLNYDHDNSKILGYPLPSTNVDDKGLYVEGALLKGVPLADDIWNLAIALKKSQAPRRIGFSIEGKVVQRDGSKILKAKIYNVAITTNPVNATCTWEAMVKSFKGGEILDKALSAGYEVNPLEMTGGDVFREEDLEKQLHNLSYVIGDEANKKILKQKLSNKKSISKSELILYLQLTKGWSYDQSVNFYTNNIIQ